MNIACIACPARYAIADEKIVGRKVRIACKRCGTKLVVDATVEPAAVRADAGTPSAPPAPRYHLAISHDQRERGDLERIVELYGRGAITAATLAWREGMSQWQPLFEVEEIARALEAAGYSSQQAGAPSYGEDDDAVTRARDYLFDDDEQTHIAKSPLDDGSHPPPRFDDEDEPTTVFDTDALHRGAGWNEPAALTAALERAPLATGGWRERGQSPLPPRSSGKPPGAWTERGLEDDEVTRMVAPLGEQPERYREPASGLQEQPPSGPGFELRRPKPGSVSSVPPSSDEQPIPLSIKPSARPPSLPPEERLTDQRSDDSVLFTLERLTKQQPAPQSSQERAELDFSDVPRLGLELGPPVAGAAPSSALLAPPAAKPKVPPPAQPSLPVDEAPEPAPGRSSKRWVVGALLLSIAAGLGALYATGRWHLVSGAASTVWERIEGLR